MRNLVLGLAAATALMGASAAAEAAPLLVAGVDTPHEAGLLQETQYIYGGHDFCWYDGGWHGPGFYWCGYAARPGWGWGGPVGWRGWYGPGYWHGGVWGGPGGYYHHDWGGWRGPHDWHGGWHGGWRGGWHHGWR